MFTVPIHVVHTATNTNPSAIATAFIALAGALLGAGTGAFTQWILDQRRTNREVTAHRKHIKVAARMMLVDLSRAESNIGYCIEHKSWWKTTGLSPRLDPSDRRLVLGELDAKGFRPVDLAEGAIDHWYGIRNYEVSSAVQLCPGAAAVNARIPAAVRFPQTALADPKYSAVSTVR
jgi:hypothetical protein